MNVFTEINSALKSPLHYIPSGILSVILFIYYWFGRNMSLIPSIGFIGGGKVAQNIAKAFLSAGIIKASQVVASCRSDADLNQFRSMGCTVTDDNKLLMKECNFVFLATHMHTVLCLKKTIAVTIARICNILALEKVYFFSKSLLIGA